MNNQYATMTQLKRRRSVMLALAVTTLVASLCLHGIIIAPNKSALFDQIGIRGRRHLTMSPLEGEYVTEEDYDAAAELAAREPSPEDSLAEAELSASQRWAVVQPYSLEDALAESNIFEYTFYILIYSPEEDEFIGLHSHKWKESDKKLKKSMKYFVYMLRRIFPERFTPDSPEWAVAIASGDYPNVKRSKLPYLDGVAPLLMFGSAFRDENMYPNMMAMPMPEPHHLDCFVEWVQHDGDGTVCKALRARGSEEGAGMVFGEEFGLEWDSLIPQLIWRGTDFGFLQTLQPRPSLVHPVFVEVGVDGRYYVPSPNNEVLDEGNNKRRIDAIDTLNENYDTLLPRWKAIALDADANLHSDESVSSGSSSFPPWADMKFSTFLNGRKSPTIGSYKYRLWESVGIATGKSVSLPELAKYKYHIDLGGGGGTTWSGTIEKLAMPGLLFHHVTPTKDYIHDRLKPWKHYIPVSPDLKDLKSKFDWAESHPIQAKRIADAGTDFMRNLGTAEGFRQMFEEDFVEPLKRVIEAYQPVSSVHPDMKSWKEVLQSNKDNRAIPVIRCSGLTKDGSCSWVGSNDVLSWKVGGRGR